MTQLAFDFEVEIEPTIDQGFPEMQSLETGHCSRCARKLKGNYSRVHGALTDGLWFAWCDTCTETAQGIHRNSEPHSAQTGEGKS